MFDITGEDVLLLNDEDLRELIGRLSAPCSPFPYTRHDPIRLQRNLGIIWTVCNFDINVTISTEMPR